MAQKEPNTDQRGPLPVWRLVSSRFNTQYQCIRFMEEELHLRLRLTISLSGDFFIRASDWSHAATLEELAASQTHDIVLVKKEATNKGVLLRYPLQLPLEPVLAHHSVAAAERCVYNAGDGRSLPTRSVQLTLRGPVPASLDLGCWGRFACRPFVPESSSRQENRQSVPPTTTTPTKKRKGRRQRRMRYQKTSPPTSPQATVVETPQTPTSEERSPVASHRKPAMDIEVKAGTTPSEKAMTHTALTREQTSQTGRAYTFSEAELRDLLIRYEHLVYQEAAARQQRIPHEPALPTVRRVLREGKEVPLRLEMEKPLQDSPQFYDHMGEQDWVAFDEDEEGHEDIYDLLLNAERDLTDEELERLYNQASDF